jgi:hypothetical protein
MAILRPSNPQLASQSTQKPAQDPVKPAQDPVFAGRRTSLSFQKRISAHPSIPMQTPNALAKDWGGVGAVSIAG